MNKTNIKMKIIYGLKKKQKKGKRFLKENNIFKFLKNIKFSFIAALSLVK